MQILPLTNDPNQTFEATLNVDNHNVTYDFNLRFNEIANYWVMTIKDPTTNSIILDSIPLVTGDYPAANLLKQYAYLGIGSMWLINISNVPAIVEQKINYPNNIDLGVDFKLIWDDTVGGSASYQAIKQAEIVAAALAAGTPLGGKIPVSQMVQKPFTSVTSIVIVHDFGQYPIVQCIDDSGLVFMPQSISNDTINQITVTFESAKTGTVICMVG
jgi:hypothetical protein